MLASLRLHYGALFATVPLFDCHDHPGTYSTKAITLVHFSMDHASKHGQALSIP